MSQFEGRHVVVTGGAGALGGAVVRALLDRGATVHVPAVENAVPERLAPLERVHVTTAVDLTSEDAVVRFYGSVPELWASVHVAGGFAMSPFVDTALADFHRMLAMNATTCFLSCREAVRRMSEGGGGGRIVNVSAAPAVAPVAGMVAYATAKAAVAAITRNLAAEVKDQGILVNAIMPSIIDTPANRKAMPDADHATWPKPAELAELMVFLASPENALTWGALVPVFGRG